MERRRFIKTSCSFCFALSAGLLESALSSCSSSPVYKAAQLNNKVTLPLSRFSESDFQIVRPDHYGYDIGVQKQPDGSYQAFELRCTHADNQVNYTGNGYSCALHGSRFDRKGLVTRGPAQQPLKKLPTSISGGNLVILIN